MIKFDKEKVILLYKFIVDETGGTYGIRDENMLDSAINSPYQTFDGKELFPSKEEKAARIGFGLISNQPFINGNKRIGVLIMLDFMYMNGIGTDFSDDEIEKIGLGVASGEMTYDILLNIIKRKVDNRF